MIRYNPADAARTWPEGQYAATLTQCEETTSRAGNDMYRLSFTIYDAERGEMSLNDYAVIPSMLWKVKRLAQAMGQGDAFNAGKFDPAEHTGKNVLVDLVVQDDDPKYGAQNRINGFAPYTSAGSVTTKAQAAAAAKAAAKSEPEVAGQDGPLAEHELPF